MIQYSTSIILEKEEYLTLEIEHTELTEMQTTRILIMIGHQQYSMNLDIIYTDRILLQEDILVYILEIY